MPVQVLSTFLDEKIGWGLLLASGSMKAMNKWFPSIGEIDEWVILATALAALILLVFKALSQGEDWRMKRLDRKIKERELDKEDTEGHSDEQTGESEA